MPENFEHGPKKNQQTDAGDDTALGLLQQRIGKRNDLAQGFFLAGEFFEKLLFKSLLKAKTLGNAEKHSRDGNDGKQGVKRQRGCPQQTAVFIIAAQCQDDDSQLPDQEGFAERQIGQSHPPYINPYKRKKSGNYTTNILS